MRVGLVDVDSHNFPNIPLMKISTYYKNLGNYVEFADVNKEYDLLFVSKIFTESKEPKLPKAKKVIKGGSGYDLTNKLPSEIEHSYPDYSLYSQYTQNTAFGILTRGCPRLNHSFCITPFKDGCVSIKVANLSEFWNGQKKIVLLDQNILSCKDKIELLNQLVASNAEIEFNGGLDVRFINEEIIELLKQMKVKDFHFAWDDPNEKLLDKFALIKEANLKRADQITVYVLVNYWSTTEQDLYRIYSLRKLGFMPYVMIYDKQKFVNTNGRWLKGIENYFSKEQIIHFKVCQHMQRWCNTRQIIKKVNNFYDYEPYKKWLDKGKIIPQKG